MNNTWYATRIIDEHSPFTSPLPAPSSYMLFSTLLSPLKVLPLALEERFLVEFSSGLSSFEDNLTSIFVENCSSFFWESYFHQACN